MTALARGAFDGHEIAIACAVAVLAQLGFVLVFSLPSPKLVNADITNDNARPIAVSITPVLKLGSTSPSKLPSQWQRKHTPPPPKAEPAPLPSPQAAKTLEAIPKANALDASSLMPVVDAAPPTVSATAATSDTGDSGAVAKPSSTEGSEQGATNGTETDPLKGRAIDRYRQELSAWFASQFHISGKLPFATLKTLHANADVVVSADRKVASFSLARPSGDPTFDAEVRATLSRVQASGVELPAPPPMYPDILGHSLPVGFQCTIEKSCE